MLRWILQIMWRRERGCIRWNRQVMRTEGVRRDGEMCLFREVTNFGGTIIIPIIDIYLQTFI